MTKSVEQAEAALAAANAAYVNELERDGERAEGSGAQERRREEHQETLRDVVAQCERDLGEAKRRAEADRPVIDMKSVVDEQLAAGRGALIFSKDTPDAVILAGIKQGIAAGTPFTVIPT